MVVYSYNSSKQEAEEGKSQFLELPGLKRKIPPQTKQRRQKKNKKGAIIAELMN